MFQISCRNLLGAIALVCSFGLVVPAMAAEPIVAKVLSGRSDMVSGGDVLIEISGVSDSAPISALLNGNKVDITVDKGSSENKKIAYIEGLKFGINQLNLFQKKSLLSKLKIVNHSITGPVFSGPQQQPFICQTEASGLGEPLNASCSATTVVDYIYKSTQSSPQDAGSQSGSAGQLPAGFKILDVTAPRPTDIAQVKTSEGHDVNFIVRRERGTINRAIYEISFLHEPGSRLPSPWNRPLSWNGRLIYKFGGGNRAGYHQGMPYNTVDDDYLTRGYAVAASSLTWFTNNHNDVIAAETAMMVKEYFIDHFGLPIYTIGVGGSGGSIQQHLIVQNYPGILDGIIPTVSYPDNVTSMFAVDCSLLDHAFDMSKRDWTYEKKTAVTGFFGWDTCSKGWMFAGGFLSPGWVKAYSTGDAPRESCDGVISRELIYHPLKNPGGIRCSAYDNQVNIYGRDPTTGFARRPFDNEGVQYGLVAFNAGIISAEQFVELNELVGGYDYDGNFVAKRSVADPKALHIAYRTGRVNLGVGGLGEIPIIDWRPYTDSLNDFHDRIRSLITRERLIVANGHAQNQIIITDFLRKPGVPYLGLTTTKILRKMEDWLDALVKDTSQGSAIEKIVRTKPKDLVDMCVTDTGERIVEPATVDGKTRCNSLYPSHTNTRIAAGGPLTDDVLKCRLKPFDPGSYAYDLSSDQIQRLRKLFEGGVCDYSRPGIAQDTPHQTWVSY